MNTTYLLIGGNKGNKRQTLKKTIELLEQKVGTIKNISDIYQTAAWGNENQPDFYNQALCIETNLSPEELLKTILSIEQALGRVRADEKWMARTIDIDILFYNEEVFNTADLTIPHPHLQERKFVLTPLVQIAPTLEHPLLKKNITELLALCKDKLAVRKVEDIAVDSSTKASKLRL